MPASVCYPGAICMIRIGGDLCSTYSCNGLPFVDHCENVDNTTRKCVCTDGFNGTRVLTGDNAFLGCTAICGDGIPVGNEECDTVTPKGACVNCSVQPGWSCSVDSSGKSVCTNFPECSGPRNLTWVLCEQWFRTGTAYGLVYSDSKVNANQACKMLGYAGVLGVKDLYRKSYRGGGTRCTCGTAQGEPTSAISSLDDSGDGFPNSFAGTWLCQGGILDSDNYSTPFAVALLVSELEYSLGQVGSPLLVTVNSNLVIDIRTTDPNPTTTTATCNQDLLTKTTRDFVAKTVKEVLPGWDPTVIQVVVVSHDGSCYVQIYLVRSFICPTLCYGHGTCIANDVCQCNPPFYGDCSKNCLNGLVSSDGKACLVLSVSNITCEWNDWGPWSACQDACSADNTQTRSQSLILNKSSSSCPLIKSDSVSCPRCAGFEPEVEQQITAQTQTGTPAYAALSLVFYMSNIGTSLTEQYGCSFTTSPNVKDEALKGFFTGYITQLGNATNQSSSNETSSKRATTNSSDITTSNITTSDITTSDITTNDFTTGDINTTTSDTNISTTTNQTGICVSDPVQLRQAAEYIIKSGRDFLVQSRGVSPDDVSYEIIPQCQVLLTVNTPGTSVLIYVLPPLIVICVLLLILLAILIMKNIPINLKPLPVEVRWQYQQFLENKKDWVKMESFSPAYYRKSLAKKSEDWERMTDLFLLFCSSY
eukprot:TRINITY_DN8369_c0_g1_i3.p1 TRINITY_DN8369_c0_g1~~TRINITY_DN8369_c0_g1_i3.p1  ORF type:complete len:704 (+),score=149.43 TRINITY_DN8369_c0_g1_i3:290-2401(+)